MSWCFFLKNLQNQISRQFFHCFSTKHHIFPSSPSAELLGPAGDLRLERPRGQERVLYAGLRWHRPDGRGVCRRRRRQVEGLPVAPCSRICRGRSGNLGRFFRPFAIRDIDDWITLLGRPSDSPSHRRSGTWPTCRSTGTRTRPTSTLRWRNKWSITLPWAVQERRIQHL